MEGVFASLDLGGTNIKCALACGDGEILVSESVPTFSHEGPEAVLNRMADLVNRLAEESGCRPVEALGIGIPGVLDLRSGTTLFLPNLPGKWRGIAVRDHLQPRVNCPVYILNDVRMAALGELTFGYGRDFPNLILVALGTGIGGGVAIDGKLRLGPVGAAGELGHMTILPDGPLCGCGNRGCLETLASGPAISAAGVRLLLSGQAPELHRITGGRLSEVTPETMVRAALEGDSTVRTEILRAADYLGIGIANIVSVLHPDLVVIAGGVAQIGDLLIDQIRRTMRERVRMVPAETVEVRLSKLGPLAGTLGGIALAMNKGLLDSIA